MSTSWIQRHHSRIITYTQEKKSISKDKCSRPRLYLADPKRRRPTELAHPFSLARFDEVTMIVASDTFMRWCNQLLTLKGQTWLSGLPKAGDHFR
jgi:hypothetical protein